MWSVTDGGTYLRVAPLSAQGTLLSRGPSLVGTGGDPADASGGLFCVFLLGFGTHSPRVLIHSLLGSFLYGAVVAKVLIVRSTRFAPWVLPVAGSLLFSILLGLWLTSALWFFTAAPAAT